MATTKSSSKTGTSKSTSVSKQGSSKTGVKSGNGRKSSATSKTGSSTKSTPSKSSSVSKTGATRSAGTAKKAGSKASAAKSAASSRTGGSKSSTGTKSGAAGKRTASGGARQSTGASRSAKTSSTNQTNKPSSSKKGSGGIIESVTKAVTGLFASSKPNAIDLLTKDHRVVDGYFQEVRDHENANHVKTYKKIQFELEAHAHVEEKIFYPYALEHGNKELQKLVHEGIEEHRQMKLFLAELDELSGDSERFKAKLKVLMEDVEHHVDEEEDEMFPLIEDQVPREVLEKLGEQMEKEKARFQKRKSPTKARRASAAR